jgi:hypothetical protein
MRIFVQDQASGPESLRPGGACEKNNHPVEVPGQAVIYLIFRGLFFEHNPREIGYAFHGAGAETCPPSADWVQRPFMDGHFHASPLLRGVGDSPFGRKHGRLAV